MIEIYLKIQPQDYRNYQHINNPTPKEKGRRCEVHLRPDGYLEELHLSRTESIRQETIITKTTPTKKTKNKQTTTTTKNKQTNKKTDEDNYWISELFYFFLTWWV